MLVYRTMLAWLGGLLTLILAVFVLARYHVGGTPSRDLRMVLRASDGGEPDLSKTMVGIAAPYVLLTLLGALALVTTRVSFPVALLSSMNALSTNGLRVAATAGGWFGNVAASARRITMIP